MHEQIAKYTLKMLNMQKQIGKFANKYYSEFQK